jgi:hypothetical protein
MEGRVVSRGRLGREWPHAILSNRARQIDRVARQGGEGVQDALYMSKGAMSRRLGNSYTTWQVAWPQIRQYASDSIRLYSQFINFDSVDPRSPHGGQQTAETIQMSSLA